MDLSSGVPRTTRREFCLFEQNRIAASTFVTKMVRQPPIMPPPTMTTRAVEGNLLPNALVPFDSVFCRQDNQSYVP